MQDAVGATDTNGESRRGDSKRKPSKILPTDRIAFSRQLDLLRAYAAASGYGNKVVTNNEVADLIKLTGSTVSLANPFFADVRFLQRADGGYTPSPEVISFAQASEWNPETASRKLGPLIAESWFARALTPRLSFTDLDENEAITVLADTASARPEYKGQLRLLLDYMESAGLIRRDGERIRLVRDSVSPSDVAPKEQQAAPSRPEPQAAKSSVVTTAFSQPMEGTVQFHVSVRVEMAEFAGWPAERIAAFFSGIAQVLAAKGAIEKEASSE